MGQKAVGKEVDNDSSFGTGFLAKFLADKLDIISESFPILTYFWQNAWNLARKMEQLNKSSFVPQ